MPSREKLGPGAVVVHEEKFPQTWTEANGKREDSGITKFLLHTALKHTEY